MCPRALLLLAAALSGVVAAGCGATQSSLDGASESVDELTDRARFCLTLARTLTAIESGSPDTAVGSAEELLGQVPEELGDEVDHVVETVRRVEADPERALSEDEELEEAADDLFAATRALCAPT